MHLGIGTGSAGAGVKVVETVWEVSSMGKGGDKESKVGSRESSSEEIERERCSDVEASKRDAEVWRRGGGIVSAGPRKRREARVEGDVGEVIPGEDGRGSDVGDDGRETGCDVTRVCVAGEERRRII